MSYQVNSEATITINGKKISDAMSATVRVALSSFEYSLIEKLRKPDNKAHDIEMINYYRERLKEIKQFL